jgi:CRISPR-associated protein Csm3
MVFVNTWKASLPTIKENKEECMRLLRHSLLRGRIETKSGLHVGTGDKGGHYGEAAGVVKSVVSQLPYIPGSTIKGKMRHLLEVKYGRTQNGRPCDCGSCPVCSLFGCGDTRRTKEPSRLIFRDCFLESDAEKLIEKVDVEKKAGVRIDRMTGKAADKALYSYERIPEGVCFAVEISIRVYEGDSVEAMKKWVSSGLSMIEDDVLGGKGTSGSGKVVFSNLVFDGTPMEDTWRDAKNNDLCKLYPITK